MKAFRSPFLVASLLSVASVSAFAQGDCKIDYGKPKELKDAEGALKKFEILGSPEDKKKNYSKAVTLLTKDPAKFQVNMVGYNMAMGRVMADWAAMPDQQLIAKKGEIGYATDSTGTVDLVDVAAAAFDEVEKAMPGCKDETEEYRRKVYGKLVNDAVNAYNNHDIDSAGVLAKKGLRVYDGLKLSYIAYNVLGNVQQSKDDYPGAIASFSKMADLMKGDTALVDERKNTMLLTAQLMTAGAETKEGDARKTEMNNAVKYLEAYLVEFPGDMKAQSAIARAQLLSGDEEAARKLFDAMLNNPDKYSDTQFLEAGVGAARADKNDVAATLFKAGLKKNPYSRDGLFNLAAVFDAAGMADSMPPLLNRLLSIDPNNPDNYRLWARYYKAKSDQLKPIATKEGASPQVEAQFKAAVDSLTMYYTKMNDAPVKVTFNLFSHDGPKHVLGGNIENLSDQDKSYVLKLEFLDMSGTVLTAKEVPVESVSAKGAKPFRVQVDDKPGIVAFRYAPLP